jgi:hypothetical protein
MSSYKELADTILRKFDPKLQISCELRSQILKIVELSSDFNKVGFFGEGFVKEGQRESEF